MPQFDPAVFLPQIFWLVILFGLIYLFIAHSAAPKITRVLERRQDRIASDLEEAERMQTTAEQVRTDYDLAMKAARATAASMVAQKRNAIKAEMETEYNQLSGELAAEAALAEQKIIVARDKALDDIRAVSVDVCQDIIQTVSGLDLDEKIISVSVNSRFDMMKETANG
ncbi:MAG: hypothetical protein GXP02_03900 [Alphaproteobacteria bacterium]|nr:hypothetical protein [Alphaproteobacteria bacterium]